MGTFLLGGKKKLLLRCLFEEKTEFMSPYYRCYNLLAELVKVKLLLTYKDKTVLTRSKTIDCQDTIFS